MRTTLDIEDDVLAAAKELAHRQGVTAGKVVWSHLRSALTGNASAQPSDAAAVAGFRPFAASDQQRVNNEQIDRCAISKASECGPGQQVAARLAEACGHPSHAFWPQQISRHQEGLIC